MRIKRIKTLFLLLILNLISISTLFAYESNKSKGTPVSFYDIEQITYSPVTTNTRNSFSEGSLRTKDAIKLVTIKTEAESEYDAADELAVPHINAENYTAKLSTISSNPGGPTSSNCSLVAKVSTEYDGEYNGNDLEGVIDYWFEIDKTRMPLYRLQYEDVEAEEFTVTLYYVIEDNDFIANNNNEYFILDTLTATNFYLFFILSDEDDFEEFEDEYNNPTTQEVPYYFGGLTENVISTAPSFDPVPNTFININYKRPDSWTPTSFFDDLGSNHLAWIVSMQIGGASTNKKDDYYVGMTISSPPDGFYLKSYDAGTGIKTIPYQIKLSKKNKNANQTIDYIEGTEIKIEKLKSDKIRDFHIYAYSDFTDTSGLNAGTFSDYIYLNFITDFLTDPGNDFTIEAF